MGIFLNNIVATTNVNRTTNVKKNKNSKEDNDFKLNHIPINSFEANQLGVYKTLLKKSNVSFGVKRIGREAPNLYIEELAVKYINQVKEYLRRTGQAKLLSDIEKKEQFYANNKKTFGGYVGELLLEKKIVTVTQRGTAYGGWHNIYSSEAIPVMSHKLIGDREREQLKKDYLHHESVVADYCLRFISGENLEDLDTDEKCEEYFKSSCVEELNVEDINTATWAKLSEQVDGIYEDLSEYLPESLDETRNAIKKLKNSIKQVHAQASKTASSFNIAKAIQNPNTCRYILYGEIASQDNDILANRNKLLMIASYGSFSSMNKNKFIQLIKTEKPDDSLFAPSKKIINIFINSEMVFDDFHDEENLYSNVVNTLQLDNKLIYYKLKLQLFEKHEKMLTEKVSQEPQKSVDEIMKDLGFSDEEKSKTTETHSKNKAGKKGKAGKKTKVTQAKHKEIQPISVEVREAKTLPKNTIIEEKDLIPSVRVITQEEYEEDIRLNGEFEAIEMTLDETLDVLGSKRLWHVDDRHDSHDRFLANKKMTRLFFENLLNNEKLDEKIRQFIKFEADSILEAQQHFVGAVLARFKARNPRLTLQEVINIIAETLSDGVLVHSYTKGHNAKLDVYSSKHCLLIPFHVDTTNQTINLRTMLDYANPEDREKRKISNSRSQKLDSYSTLNTLHNNVLNKKNIPMYTLENILNSNSGFTLLDMLYQRQT